MKELAVIVAGIMPKEKLIEMLEVEIQNWKNDPTKENFEKLGSTCAMVALKATMPEGDPGAVIDTIKEMDSIERARNLINPKGN